MIAIVDYGVGNLFSLSSSLTFLGLSHEVTGKEKDLSEADRILLPGVGAFPDAIEKLKATGLVPVLRAEAKKGKPLLGICLGMQLLFSKSLEYGESEGLDLLPGRIVPFLKGDLKIPHMGWNNLELIRDHPIFKYSRNNDYVYYVHSFYAAEAEAVTLAVSSYGQSVPGVVARDNVLGMQFHPEKSGAAGLALLRAFSEL